MSSFLNKIRNKPIQQKKKIFFVSIFLAMITVVMVWYFLSAVLKTDDRRNQMNADNLKLDNIKELYEDSADQFSEIIDNFSNEI